MRCCSRTHVQRPGGDPGRPPTEAVAANVVRVASVTTLSAEPDPAPIGEKRQPLIVSSAALSIVTAAMPPRATAAMLMSHPDVHDDRVVISVQRRGEYR